MNDYNKREIGESMKKGFTLVELLAVIIVIGLVLTITIPVVSNILENSYHKTFLTNANLMQEAAEKYFVENVIKLPSDIGEVAVVFLDTLISKEYIEPITDPRHQEETCYGHVLVTKTTTQAFSYVPYLYCSIDYQTDNYQEYVADDLILYLSNMSPPTLIGGKYYWPDSSGHNNNAELINMTMTLTSGYDNYKKAYLLDGVNDYFRIPHQADFITYPDKDFTYSIWLKASDYTTKQMILTKTHPCNNPAHFQISIADNTLFFDFYSDLDGGAATHKTEAILTNGQLYNIVWVKKWGQLGVKVYVNGNLETIIGDSTKKGTSYTFNPIFIGARNGNGTSCQSDPFPFQFYKGELYSILIYNRLLTESDIKYNYIYGKTRIESAPFAN